MIVVAQCLFWVAVLMVGCMAGALGIAVWIGRGESDVNGDPERDAGLLEPPLPRVECAWCHIVLRRGPLPVSHGLCPACLGKTECEFKELRAKS